MDGKEQEELRRRAEEKLDQRLAGLETKLDHETARLLHELKVHQVELEMQNEELRRTQEELEESRSRYAELYHKAPVGLLTLDRHGLLLEANDTLLSMLGLERELVLGTPFRVRVAEQDKNRFAAFLVHACRRQQPQALEIRLQRTDGSELAARLECLAACPQEEEHRLSVVDLTERRRLELQQMQAQKIESLGVLAGGIAHDFNNLLTSIVGNLSLAQLYLGENDRAAAKLDLAEQAALRARDLTGQLLTFARGGEPVKKQIALPELVQEAAGLPLKDSPCRIDFDLPPGLWPGEADPGQLGQVVQNLIVNAAQAMPEGGVIEVWGRNVELAEGNPLQLKPGRYVRLAVRDHGQGIAPDVQDKIFDPYFSTKPKGSGLGLAVSRAIITQHGGALTVQSQPGRGALFETFLPAAGSQAGRPEAVENAMPELIPGQGRVLIMDDEEAVRAIAVELVGHLGYETAQAADGGEAVCLYQEARQQGKPFDAVILDLVVPGGMGGEDTLLRLREMDPQVQAIVSSGYSDKPIVQDFQRYGFRASLPKPYNLTQLSRVLHEVVAEGRVRVTEES